MENGLRLQWAGRGPLLTWHSSEGAARLGEAGGDTASRAAPPTKATSLIRGFSYPPSTVSENNKWENPEINKC